CHFGISIPTGCVIAFTTCSPESTVASVADSLLRSLSRSTGIEFSNIKKSSWSITAKAQIIEASANNETTATSPTESASRVVEAINIIRQKLSSDNAPILFIIDESDIIPDHIHIGSFTRNIKEMVAAEGLAPVAFVLAGQKDLVPRLQEEHPSLPRSYELIWLPLLQCEDCEKIIKDGEDSTGVEFDQGIRKAIAHSSKGFPAVVHRIADSCFRVDKDGYIDLFDFEDGLAAAIDGFTREDRLEAIYRLAGPKGIEVLTLLSSEPRSRTTEDIATSLAMNSTDILPTLEVLESAKVLGNVESKYEIKDRLVAAYVALETTRQRDIHAIKVLANILESRGWHIRGLGPDDYRAIDMVISKGKWILRRTVGVAYIGEASRLSSSGAERLINQVGRAKQLYSVKEIWVVGVGEIDSDAMMIIERQPSMTYYPWRIIERGSPLY
ncbi:MAG: hypothetical protein OEV64_14790, partial [Desulfobulbaceae bacterium]|nr:hypothetical protein [Desulfobulbaceae bacterium]